jgi:hypothetical protein
MALSSTLSSTSLSSSSPLSLVGLVHSLLVGLLLGSVVTLTAGSRQFYTDQYVLQLPGNPDIAKQIAQQHGFTYLGHVRTHSLSLSLSLSFGTFNDLCNLLCQRLTSSLFLLLSSCIKQIFGDYHHLQHSRIAKRSLRPADSHHHTNLTAEPEVQSLSQQKLLRRVKRDFIPISVRPRDSSRPLPALSSLSSGTAAVQRPRFDDPKWPQMWYLVSLITIFGHS